MTPPIDCAPYSLYLGFGIRPLRLLGFHSIRSQMDFGTFFIYPCPNNVTPHGHYRRFHYFQKETLDIEVPLLIHLCREVPLSS